MDHIIDGFNVSDITTQATGFISAFSPVATLVIGILLGFLVIRIIIGLLSPKNKMEDEEEEEEEFDDDYY